MKTTRGVIALALLALLGCDDAPTCPGVGEHRGGLVSVSFVSVISSDCVEHPTQAEVFAGLIAPDGCELDVREYQDEAMCDYSVRSVCSDSAFGWGFNGRFFYIGDDTYSGDVRFARSDLDGNLICSGEYEVTYTNIR